MPNSVTQTSRRRLTLSLRRLALSAKPFQSPFEHSNFASAKRLFEQVLQASFAAAQVPMISKKRAFWASPPKPPLWGFSRARFRPLLGPPPGPSCWQPLKAPATPMAPCEPLSPPPTGPPWTPPPGLTARDPNQSVVPWLLAPTWILFQASKDVGSLQRPQG